MSHNKKNKIDVIIIPGLKTKYAGNVLAVLLIDTPPSKYGKVGPDRPICSTLKKVLSKM